MSARIVVERAIVFKRSSTKKDDTLIQSAQRCDNRRAKGNRDSSHFSRQNVSSEADPSKQDPDPD